MVLLFFVFLQCVFKGFRVALFVFLVFSIFGISGVWFGFGSESFNVHNNEGAGEGKQGGRS